MTFYQIDPKENEHSLFYSLKKIIYAIVSGVFGKIKYTFLRNNFLYILIIIQYRYLLYWYNDDYLSLEFL